MSLSFGSRLTYLAALNVLEADRNTNYNPGWGDQLTFELYQKGDEWFLRLYNNDDQIFLGNSDDGTISLDEFNQYVCSRLYYGDMAKVKAGEEDFHEKANLKGDNCSNLKNAIPLFGCRKIIGYQKSMDFDSHKSTSFDDGQTYHNDGSVSIGGRYGFYLSSPQTHKLNLKRNLQSSYSWQSGKPSSSNGYSYSWNSGNTGNSGSNSYSWSSGDQSYANADNNDNSYGYSWNSGDQGSSNSDNNYSWSSGDQSSGSESTGSNYSWFAGNGETSSSSNPESYQQWKINELSREYGTTQHSNYQNFESRPYSDTRTGVVNKQEFCPLEYSNPGFKEIGRTDVDVTVTVKKPVTTYVEEEV